jgi:hypothetical protein
MKFSKIPPSGGMDLNQEVGKIQVLIMRNIQLLLTNTSFLYSKTILFTPFNN